MSKIDKKRKKKFVILSGITAQISRDEMNRDFSKKKIFTNFT
jgi:hypothetical protein